MLLGSSGIVVKRNVFRFLVELRASTSRQALGERGLIRKPM